MAPFSQTHLDFLINHLFLLPKLPQADDRDDDLDKALLCLVTESLAQFVTHLPSHQQSATRTVLAAVEQMTTLRDIKGSVDEAKLLEALETLENAPSGTYAPAT